MSQPVDRSGAIEFEDEGVVAAYVHRPAYPETLIARLLELMPERGRVLDLGCGPGKLACAMSPHVTEVVAVDPSAAMVRLAQSRDRPSSRNVRWVQARAEDMELAWPIHLAVAGAAIHWIEPSLIFPKLACALAPGAPVAIVEGDAPTAATWIDSYKAVIIDWVERLGGHWNDETHRARMTDHEAWLLVHSRETFVRHVRQPLEDLIECQHSRATFARRRMGPLASAFDADLRAALSPWSENGFLSYEMETQLAWGFPSLR